MIWSCDLPPAKYTVTLGIVVGDLYLPSGLHGDEANRLDRTPSEETRRADQGRSIASLFHDEAEDAALAEEGLETDIDDGQRLIFANGRVMRSKGLGHRLVLYEAEVEIAEAESRLELRVETGLGQLSCVRQVPEDIKTIDGSTQNGISQLSTHLSQFHFARLQQ